MEDAQAFVFLLTQQLVRASFSTRTLGFSPVSALAAAAAAAVALAREFSVK